MKTDFQKLEAARLPCSPGAGSFNGIFRFHFPGEARQVCVIASDYAGWQHVSVSFGQHSNKPPAWAIMCAVKEIFWGDDEWVMQLHPPASENISNHDGCLHLWRPCEVPIPVPPGEFVGLKGVTSDQMKRASKHLEALAKQKARA